MDHAERVEELRRRAERARALEAVDRTLAKRAQAFVMILTITTLLVALIVPTLISRRADVGSTPDATSSSSSTSAPSDDPTSDPSATVVTPPVDITVQGTEAPVIVVMQPPAAADSESGGSGWIGIIGAISAGLVAVITSTATLIWALRRPRGGEPPTAPEA